MEQQKIMLDLNQTTPIKDNKGNQIWDEGFLLRKVPGILVGSKDPQVYPIPIFYNVETKEILKDSVPKQLWKELGLEEDKPKFSVVK